MNKTEKDALQQCRYYKGETSNPYEGKDQDKALLWFYECCWAKATNKAEGGNAPLAEYVNDYLAVGLGDFAVGDSVPMSLKALLFNRYARDSYSMADAVEGFKDFYNRYYK